MEIVYGTMEWIAREIGGELLLPVDIDQLQREGVGHLKQGSK